jgi:phosphatidate cytidylyltransferase
MPAGQLGRRVSVAAVGIPLALILLYVGGWILTIVISGIALMATRELFSLGKVQGVLPFSGVGMAGSVALVLVAGATQSFSAAAPWQMGIVLGIFLLSSAMAVTLRWPQGRPLAAVSLTVVGVLIGGGCFSFAVFLWYLPATVSWVGSGLPFLGLLLVAFPISVTWVGDTLAYFMGRRFGRRKLIPPVSPGKTVVGGVAGLLGSVFMGALAGWVLLDLYPETALSVILGAAMGLVLGVAAQVGDLAESVTKREAGVKDSGTLLPGHGGVLDRFDGVIFNLPLAYLLIHLVGLLH